MGRQVNNALHARAVMVIVVVVTVPVVLRDVREESFSSHTETRLFVKPSGRKERREERRKKKRRRLLKVRFVEGAPLPW